MNLFIIDVKRLYLYSFSTVTTTRFVFSSFNFVLLPTISSGSSILAKSKGVWQLDDRAFASDPTRHRVRMQSFFKRAIIVYWRSGCKIQNKIKRGRYCPINEKYCSFVWKHSRWLLSYRCDEIFPDSWISISVQKFYSVIIDILSIHSFVPFSLSILRNNSIQPSLSLCSRTYSFCLW